MEIYNINILSYIPKNIIIEMRLYSQLVAVVNLQVIYIYILLHIPRNCHCMEMRLYLD